MHPTFSIIFFTSASGAGYGLLALAGAFGAGGLLPPERGFGAALLGLALALVSLGLIASTFHLRHPERAWRSLSQWRSSWLSREAVAALLTYLPALAFAAGWVGFEAIWGWLGILGALLALATLVCTGMIYASLKPIRAWHTPWVPASYLGFALMTGALWLAALLSAFGVQANGALALALASSALAWALKAGHWRHLERAPNPSSPETATGLGRFGSVRPLDPPHTGENYLTHEMGFQIARKHAAKLRRLALLFGLLLPAGLILILFFAEGWWTVPIAFAAAFSGMLGVVIERWLFFAEAKHTTALYYGERRA
ncbi:MAG: DmsC/YnfH family molybdoenzyme membrane anchor subunit [Alphaproteobacteria bacterium]